MVIAFERSLHEVPMLVLIDGEDENKMEDFDVTRERASSRPAQPILQSLNVVAAQSRAAPVATPNLELPPDDPLEIEENGLGSGHRVRFYATGKGGRSREFMGIRGSGDNILLVIDTSASMPRNCGESGIAAIRREIINTINGFPDSSFFNIICYATDADSFRAQSVRATHKNKFEAIRFMRAYFGDSDHVASTRTSSFGGDSLGARDPMGIDYFPIYPKEVDGLEGTGGGSRIELGVVAAMRSKPSTIFVLSDGEPVTMRDDRIVSHAELVDIIHRNYRRIYKGRKLVVHTVSIRNLGEKFLRQVSSGFDGEHREIDPETL